MADELSTTATSARVDEATVRLRDTLLSSLTILPVSFRFMQDNRVLFDGQSMILAEGVLKDLYGTAPQYLNPRGIQTGGHGVDIEALLSAATSTTAIEAAAADLLQVLTVLEEAYAKSERNFFVGDIAMSDERFVSYNEFRTNLRTVSTSVRAAQTNLATIQDGSVLAAVGRSEAITRAEATLDVSTALIANAENSVGTSESLAQAEAQLVAAQIDLGISRSPFAGVVSAVLVELGQYVQPGTPLFTIVGEGAREIKLSVPLALLPLVQTGTPYLVQGKVVGSVDRVAAQATGGNALVVISLTEPFPVGVTLSGALNLSMATSSPIALRQVLPEEIRFTATGPFIETVDNETIAVSILADNGTVYLISTERPVSATLRKHLSTSFSR